MATKPNKPNPAKKPRVIGGLVDNAQKEQNTFSLPEDATKGLDALEGSGSIIGSGESAPHDEEALTKEGQDKINNVLMAQAQEAKEEQMRAKKNPKAVTYWFKNRSGSVSLFKGRQKNVMQNNTMMTVEDKFIIQALNHLYTTANPEEILALDTEIERCKAIPKPCPFMRHDDHAKMVSSEPTFVEFLSPDGSGKMIRVPIDEVKETYMKAKGMAGKLQVKRNVPLD